MLDLNNFEDLSLLIKETRKKQNLSQEDLAGIANTGARFIVDLENAKATCQIGKVFQVINALGLDLKVLNVND